MVEEMLAARSIEVTYETVRRWAQRFGKQVVKNIRHRSVAFDDKWHLDEMVIKINGRTLWLWRAVDQHGAVLDVLVQSRRNSQVAARLMRKLIRRHGLPRVMITVKLESYPAANKDLGLKFEHRQDKGLNNRCENSHEATRLREKVMRQFKSARQLQRSLSTHYQVANDFLHCRYNRDAKAKRAAHAQALRTWEEVSCAQWMKRDAN